MAVPPQQGIQFQAGGQAAVTAEMAPRHVVYHPVTSQEIDMVAALSNSIHVAFLGIAVGAFIAFWITLRTVTNLTADDRTMFRVLMWVTGFMSAYLLVQSGADVLRSRKTRDDIKRRSRVEG
jgi:ABC-type phosphate/phosphonate transport system permease subunit